MFLHTNSPSQGCMYSPTSAKYLHKENFRIFYDVRTCNMIRGSLVIRVVASPPSSPSTKPTTTTTTTPATTSSTASSTERHFEKKRGFYNLGDSDYTWLEKEGWGMLVLQCVCFTSDLCQHFNRLPEKGKSGYETRFHETRLLSPMVSPRPACQSIPNP